jgi:hypothetical protein
MKARVKTLLGKIEAPLACTKFPGLVGGGGGVPGAAGVAALVDPVAARTLDAVVEL